MELEKQVQMPFGIPPIGNNKLMPLRLKSNGQNN